MFSYALTITKVPLYRTTRVDIFQIFENLSIELLVAQEDHADMYTVHYHIYIFCSIEQSYEEIFSILKESFDFSFGLYFERCHNKDAYIHYSTKEDFQFISKNIDHKLFNFNYEIVQYCFSKSKFDDNDEFVIKNKRLSNYICYRFNQIKKLSQPVYPLFEYQIINAFTNWRQSVIEWFNKNLDEKNRKALFLYGISDSGKSSFINNLFGHLKNQIFLPVMSLGINAWSEWDPKIYNLVIIDQIGFSQRDCMVLNKILKKEVFIVKKKYTNSKKNVLVKCPIILISNQGPPIDFDEMICSVETEAKLESDDFLQIKNFVIIDPKSKKYFLVFKLPLNLEIQRLSNIYSPQIAKMTDVNHQQKINFFNLVVPALADPKIIKDLSDMPRFVCNFEECKEETKSFASKQKFVQHLKIMHDQELPGGCMFLYPNDKSTVPGGFWCSVCGHHYCRRDHLQNHIRTSTHCKNASVAVQNPLELRELEIENRLAIEGSSLPKSNSFDFKRIEYKSLLSIEWKPVVIEHHNRLLIDKLKEKRESKGCFSKIVKSFSMMTLNRRKDSNELTRKSKTYLNIFTSFDASFNLLNSQNDVHVKNENNKRKLDDCEVDVKNKKLMVAKEEKNEDEESDDEILIKTLMNFENKYLTIKRKMDKSFYLIDSDSDDSIIILDNEKVEIEDRKKITELKRDLSFDTKTNDSVEPKKLKNSNEIKQTIIESLCISKSSGSKVYSNKVGELGRTRKLNNNLTLRLHDFYSSDVRLDRRLYFNRVDFDDNVDIHIYVLCEIEAILDLVCSKSIIYTTEHYYHQLFKRRKFDSSNELFKQMKHEYEDVFEKQDSLQSNTEDFILLKRNYENQLKNQENVCRFHLMDLRNFCQFILETYEKMCRKVKDVKQEELNRLKEKYSYVLNGRLEMNVIKIGNFVDKVLPVLVLQFLEQDKTLRYK
ncbi:hypothetical protein BpHYR1_036274, partial [Brachionus plicatilis]